MFASLTGAVYSGAALHRWSGVHVQLHCVLLRCLGAYCWYGLLPFSCMYQQMSNGLLRSLTLCESCFTRTVALACNVCKQHWLPCPDGCLSATHHQLAYTAVSFSEKANLHVSLNSYYS